MIMRVVYTQDLLWQNVRQQQTTRGKTPSQSAFFYLTCNRLNLIIINNIFLSWTKNIYPTLIISDFKRRKSFQIGKQATRPRTVARL